MMAKFLKPFNGSDFEPWYINFVNEYNLWGDENYKPADYTAALAEWNGTGEGGIGFQYFVFENDADATMFLLRWS
jgi:hypothetical protein